MKTLIHVWYDQGGKIIAVGRPAKHMTNRVQPMAAKAGHSVLSTEVEDDIAANIIRTHFVDTANSQLKLKE